MLIIFGYNIKRRITLFRPLNYFCPILIFATLRKLIKFEEDKKEIKEREIALQIQGNRCKNE